MVNWGFVHFVEGGSLKGILTEKDLGIPAEGAVLNCFGDKYQR